MTGQEKPDEAVMETRTLLMSDARNTMPKSKTTKIALNNPQYMKKILLSAMLICSLFLASCSVDWNNDKDKKIAELEKQVQDLEKIKEEQRSVLVSNKNLIDENNVKINELNERLSSKTQSKQKLDNCLTEAKTIYNNRLNQYRQQHWYQVEFALLWQWLKTDLQNQEDLCFKLNQ